MYLLTTMTRDGWAMACALLAAGDDGWDLGGGREEAARGAGRQKLTSRYNRLVRNHSIMRAWNSFFLIDSCSLPGSKPSESTWA